MEINVEHSPEENAAVANLTRGIANSPKLRRRYLELVKDFAPATVIPELDESRAIRAELEPLQTELLQTKQDLDRFKLEGHVRDAWDKVKRTHKLTDADIPAVQKVMEERLIGDPMTAADYYTMSRRLAVPRTSVATRLQVPWKTGLDEYKGLWKDKDGWARARAEQGINEIIAAREGVA